MNINQFDIIENITLSRALFTAAELNIAEYLETKPLALEELAFLTQTTPSTLKRLLYFLCLKNIFTHELDGTYSLPSHSQNLLQHHPASIKPFLLHDDESRWNCFGHLTYCIQSGKPAFDMLYGKDYFTSLKENPLLSKRFDEAINIISNQEDAAIAQQLSCHGVVADIGGGNGQLINKLITQTAVSSGILFDLPNVVTSVPLTPKLHVVGGSFFESIHITADMFILKRILHDWNDDQALLILNQIAATMHQNSTLLIIEGILDQAQQSSTLAAIDLLLLSIFGGKERSLQEFEELANQAGLVIFKVTTVTPLLSIILCHKK